ncbi:MAG TPA: restriction endonuclease subunit S [Methylotenera sp.]
MSFPRYSSYKDSCVNWLGEVPEHWVVLPCRAIVHERTEKNDGAACEDYLSLMANVGIIPYAEKGDVGNKKPEDLSKCKIVTRGDLVINSMNYGIGSYGLSGYDGVCSPVYIVLKPQNDIVESRFAFRIFENKAFQTFAQSFGNGILEHRSAINWDILKSIGIAVPPQAEQKAILVFLDRETTKIDDLIAEQQRLIDLLKEKRQAVISHVVTKGLNPDVTMKDSGVAWLGDVPLGWTVASVRRVIQRIEQGWSPDCYSRPAEMDEWGVVKSGCVNRGVFVEQENKALPETLDPIPEYEIHNGDVLMSRASGSPDLVGSAAYITATRQKLMLSDKIFRIHPINGVNRKFLVAVFNSRVMRSQIERAISGADGLANNLPQSSLKGFHLAIPPLEEQKEIVSFLECELLKFDSLAEETQQGIDLLQERRAALISAAVTGKIDVRNVYAKEVA